MIATPRTPAKKFAYVNTTIVQCRLFGIYKHYIHQRYERMMDTIADTIAVLKYTPEIDMDQDTYRKVLDALERSRIEFAVKNSKGAHKRLRELYYELQEF